MLQISVLGAGGWGIAFAVMCHNAGHKVTLWSALSNEIDEITLNAERPKVLKGIKIPKEIELSKNIHCVENSDIIVIATASFAVRQTANKLRGIVQDNVIVVCLAKGLESDTFKNLSDVIEEELPNVRVVALSGPSHAEEVALNVPTALVAASSSKEAAITVQETFMNPYLRIYTSSDIIGVQLGGALKNIIALAAGICDGLGLGDNTKAALMTRGISEMARLGVARGGKKETFTGLTGIGDLIVTCTSMHSRNRRAGILIGQGIPPKEAIAQIGMTVEGYAATEVAYLLSQKYNVDMPIVNATYEVLYQNKEPKAAISELMSRGKKNEIEEIWKN
jgi:glycerol-3-phosphate dehydrogenase (NAD(P)+)